MTGFARASGTTGPVQWLWEIRTVNGRGLDIRVRVPNGFEAAGEAARAALSKALARGQCQLGLTLTRPEAAARVRIDEDLLARLAAAAARVPRPEGVGPATLDGLLAVRGVVEVETEASADPERLNRDLAAGIDALVADLVAARRAEGAQLRTIVGGQLTEIARLTQAAEECPARRPEAVRARLADSVALLVGSGGLDHGAMTGRDLDPGPVQPLAQLRQLGLVFDDRQLGPPAQGLLRQPLGVAPGGQGGHLDLGAGLFQEIESGNADRAGGTQNADAARQSQCAHPQ